MSDRGSTSGGRHGKPDTDNLSGAYVLNALSDEEREAFEVRMSESDEIRTEVAELRETALLLGHAVKPVAPSAGLRASLMGLLDSTPQLPPLEAPAATSAEMGHDERGLQDAPANDTGSLESGSLESGSLVSESGRRARPAGELRQPTPLARQRWFTRPAVILVGAAAAFGLVFGGGQVISSITGPGTSQTPPQADGTLSQILTASDVSHTVGNVSTGGKATLYWSNKLQRSALILDGVTSLPSGKTYQLWYIKGSKVASAGTVSATSNNVSQVLQGELVKGDIVGVTVEPTGGSKQPTSKPIVSLQSA